MLGSVNLTSVNVKGVAAALEKHTPKGESKGIKAYFRMDENGILNLEKVRYMPYSVLQQRVARGLEKHQGITYNKEICFVCLYCFFLLEVRFCTENYQ